MMEIVALHARLKRAKQKLENSADLQEFMARIFVIVM
jgi:hypothetical protein